MYVLYLMWYEGDSNLVDDTFCYMSEDINKLIVKAKENNADVVYMPGESWADDGYYGDNRVRFRIAEEEPL